MSIVLLGVNHKTAPIALRERLAIPAARLPEAVLSLSKYPGVREGMILSTCNRVEFLAAEDQPPANLLHFVRDYFSIDPAELAPHLYHYHEREAMLHLFRVAASLDSMIVGEPQILGQVRESYSIARAIGAVQSELDALMQRALTVAKKVRTETQIGSTAISIASIAVELARKIFGSLDGKTVCLVGAGKMGELAARHLLTQGAAALLVANRTHERAVLLAENFAGEAVRMEDLMARMEAVDIVITSTGAGAPIFRREHGQQFLQRRKNRPMFFIDIAVPRDVDPEMNKLEGIFVYDIDDLQSVAAQHLAGRAGEANQAERIVLQEMDRFQRRMQTTEVAPLITALREQFEQVRQSETARVQSQLGNLSEEQIRAVDALTRGLLNKLLHSPIQALKAAAQDGDAEAVEMLAEALDLRKRKGRQDKSS